MSAVTEATSTKITEDQANDAIRQMLTERQQPESPAPVTEAAPIEQAEPPTEETQVETAAEEATPEAAVETATETTPDDDVASLRQRLTEREQKIAETEQKYQSRLAALQQRNQESERILRERYLRKSTAADRALKTLRAVRSESGAPEAEVDRVIQEVESTMNPQSASYVPPTPQVESAEEQAIVVNRFLNEKLMDAAEADEFGKWLKTDAGTEMSPAEQELHRRDIDGFLRIAHVRYQESIRIKANKRTEAVEAAKMVQRTQKQAARAASAAPTAPRKTITNSTPPNTIDYSKVTQDDVAKWVRQSVEQYK